MKKQKTELLTLKIACLVIWAMLGVLVFLLIEDLSKFLERSKNSQQFQQVENSVIVTGDSNTITINLLENPKNSFKKTQERSATIHALKVLKATEAWSVDVTLAEAITLSNQIKAAAVRHKLPLEIAFAIVHIESDFRVNAFNQGGKAYGLCQVTKPCLEEYNWKHSHAYTLEEMLDAEKNLEVGFWYYARLIYHYSKYPAYGITMRNNKTILRDCYIAYNFGITQFKNIGKRGRNELRAGRYPISIYGRKVGSRYEPYFRYEQLADQWL